jgi:hypothetical protein
MDHEFGTSFLESGQRGWDWFSIQFDDGTELMIFQLRREDGSLDPRSSGTWIGASGEASPIAAETFSLVPAEKWRSEVSGAEYPTRWTIEVPEIRFHVCDALLSDGLGENYPYSREINLQTILSGAVFTLEHQDKIRDDVGAYIAGVEGSCEWPRYWRSHDQTHGQLSDGLIVMRDQASC